MVTGYSTKRSSIPEFSKLIGKTRLREVTVQEIGVNKVFRYDVKLKPDSLYPYAGSRAATWHDSVQTAIGTMETGPESVSAAPAPGVKTAAPAAAPGGNEDAGVIPEEKPPEQ
jgi:hypothetical protein